MGQSVGRRGRGLASCCGVSRAQLSPRGSQAYDHGTGKTAVIFLNRGRIMSVFTNPASAAGDQAKAYVTAVLGLLGSADPIEVLRQTPSALQRKLGEMSAAEIGRPEAPGKGAVGQGMEDLG